MTNSITYKFTIAKTNLNYIMTGQNTHQKNFRNEEEVEILGAMSGIYLIETLKRQCKRYEADYSQTYFLNGKKVVFPTVLAAIKNMYS